MNNNHTYIINLCQQLELEGKTPSLALVRNRGERSLTIPEVIKALKSWQQSPKQALPLTDDAPQENNSATSSLEQRVEKLEQQVVKLTAALNAVVPQNQGDPSIKTN